ncbi:hypothetical protein [Qipengyuania sp. 902]
MDGNIISIIVALILIVIAWKVFKGIVKTVVLAAILIAVAIFVFGGFA